MKHIDPNRYSELKASGRLPSPKGVAFAIIKLLQRDDYNIQDLVRLVQSDPAIAGRLLKFSNAAAFGQRRPIVSLAKATIALGAFRVRDLVLAFSVLQGNRTGKCAEFDYKRFWSRALACAIAAQALSVHAQIAAEENFTAGLLCSVGELALASIFPDRYGAILANQGPVEERINQEQTAFQTDHRELSAALFMEWGLPEVLAAAVYHAELPDEAGFSEGSRGHILALSLHFSLAMADICVSNENERWALIPDLFSKAARLGIGTDELTALADAVTASWREWGDSLSIQTHEIPPFADLLASTPPREVKNSSPDTPEPNDLSALVVCNDQQEAYQMGGYLEADGYVVHYVFNGKEGLDFVLSESPDLVLLEMNMSGVDGALFCQAVRENHLSRGAYIILIGNPADEVRLTQMLDAGADDFMIRPITIPTLQARLIAADKIMQLHNEIRRERNDRVRSAGEWAGTQRRLIQVAMTDPLTRLPNRRHGMDFLSAEWVFAQANNLPLAVLMVDIDFFKQVNDEYGHEAGDHVLAKLSSLLQTSARVEDMAFRYGGEEFCVICPGSDVKTACVIAERIRLKVAEEKLQNGKMNITRTVSIGVAAMKSTHQNAEALIAEADQALYSAKRSGRNRVEF